MKDKSITKSIRFPADLYKQIEDCSDISKRKFSQELFHLCYLGFENYRVNLFPIRNQNLDEAEEDKDKIKVLKAIIKELLDECLPESLEKYC